MVLTSGDRFTGEVKKLERGKLKYKTDEVGTIYIEWDSVLEITSKDVLVPDQRHLHV